MPSLLLPLLLYSTFSLLLLLAAEPIEDRAALLQFINQVPHANRIRWNTNVSTCRWVGVTCNSDQTAVQELRLPGAALFGPIPPNTIGRLSNLRVLSLRSNAFTGSIPTDIANLTSLRSLYLQENNLTGNLPAGIGDIRSLRRIDVSYNNLTGEIPPGFTNSTWITAFFLQNNSFSGGLPDITTPTLSEFDVSYNMLNGSIPPGLQRFPAASFTGNLNLCGGPLSPCFTSPPPGVPALPPAPKPSHKSNKKLPIGAIIAIAAAMGVALLVVLVLLILCFCQRKRTSAKTTSAGNASPREEAAGTPGLTTSSNSISRELTGMTGATGGVDAAGERNRLVFVGRGGGYSFDLEDLLRASAEVLGKGSVGSSYRAVLEEGTTVVVKRLKDVAATSREFNQYMDVLGRPEVQECTNVLPVRAYYYSKDEKLLVLDYLPAGSLAALLHGSRGSLDWESRVRIAIAVGRGLAHLHGQARMVHGNIKASNVLLREDPEAATLSDYGLTPLLGPTAPLPSRRAAGYLAPEVLEGLPVSYKSDVYSFGVLLMELLTGKSPNQIWVAGEEGTDLPRWVESVVREEWTGEVFDDDMMRQPNMEEEMLQLLHIAISCVAVLPDTRPRAQDVVDLMMDIGRFSGSINGGQLGSSDEIITSPAAPTP